MADRPIVETGLGMLPRPARIVVEDGKISEQTALYLQGFLEQIVSRINGRLSLGNAANATRFGNFSAQCVTFTTPLSGNIFIPHGLGRPPVGWWIIFNDGYVQLKAVQTGDWNSNTMYLAADTAGVEVTVVIF